MTSVNIFKMRAPANEEGDFLYMGAAVYEPDRKTFAREWLLKKSESENVRLWAEIIETESGEILPIGDLIPAGSSGLLLTRKAFDAVGKLFGAESLVPVDGLPVECVLAHPRSIKEIQETEDGFEAVADSVPNVFLGWPSPSRAHCSEAFKNEWERRGLTGMKFIPAGTLTIRHPAAETASASD